MEERIIKFAAGFFVVLTIVVGVSLYFFPALHVKAVEWADERQALAELASENQAKMTELTLAASTGEVKDASGEKRQLQLRLPEGVTGEQISFHEDYVTQTVTMEIPAVDATYFDQDPLMGSSNHIDNLSYALENGAGEVEIVLDRVYELETSYDDSYFYIDFIDPHDIYDKVVSF